MKQNIIIVSSENNDIKKRRLNLKKQSSRTRRNVRSRHDNDEQRRHMEMKDMHDKHVRD